MHELLWSDDEYEISKEEVVIPVHFGLILANRGPVAPCLSQPSKYIRRHRIRERERERGARVAAVGRVCGFNSFVHLSLVLGGVGWGE